jgi:YgiT-type zinc finger domain-containing protein
MHRRYLTFLTYLDDELITVPNFPSWVCDLCGRREYDVRALNQLMLILSPNAGKPPKRRRSTPKRLPSRVKIDRTGTLE